ncbi:Crp/Fnr family transcriptional regulator [Nevskia sp.]|uniref:Crp/Fnr family transcriptional regulator n=1 Tax=Nevskia sp. TaxID=1929292 RepID=UPI0025E20C59|nr:Crp/Fnr family transcriptional regulator [Nevskia sp.]
MTMNAPSLASDFAGWVDLGKRPLRPEASAAASLTDGPCVRLFDDMPTLDFAEGAPLFRQGTTAREVFLLEHGLVKVVFLDPGGEEVIAQICSTPGTVIGDACAILGRHFVSAVVVTRNTRLRRIGADKLIEQVRNNSELSWHLHRSHCQRHAELLDRAAQLGYLSVRKRVEQLIWDLSTACELLPTRKGLRMELPLKYRELAQLISVSPEHLCRTLASMQKEGLILREKGWLFLIERDALFRRSRR